MHKGKLREILGLPEHLRHIKAKDRQHWSVLTYEACEKVFRNPELFSNAIQGQPNPENKLTMGILEMDPPMHRAYRRTIRITSYNVCYTKLLRSADQKAKS